VIIVARCFNSDETLPIFRLKCIYRGERIASFIASNNLKDLKHEELYVLKISDIKIVGESLVGQVDKIEGMADVC